MQPAADEQLPAIIEEILNPTPGYWRPEAEERAEEARKAETQPPKQTEERPQEQPQPTQPPAITGEDVEVLLEHPGLKALVAEGFDATELQELEDIDPLEQDFSDDPLVVLELATLG